MTGINPNQNFDFMYLYVSNVVIISPNSITEKISNYEEAISAFNVLLHVKIIANYLPPCKLYSMLIYTSYHISFNYFT